MNAPETPSFVRSGPLRPVSPLVLSVPHAGRDYSAELLARARVRQSQLEMLEDRLVDRLIWRAAAAGPVAIVARAPRAEIDLNRDEREIDPLLVTPPMPSTSVVQTVRSRAGIGLVPSHISGTGPLWIDRLPRSELSRRIQHIHRPYHAALDEALQVARGAFGVALLLDCHSMPSRSDSRDGAQIVFGDRHGTSCAPDLVECAVALGTEMGFRTACNVPYAGGYILRRHGRPAAGIHALQVEVDRSTYLAEDLRSPGPGFDRICSFFSALGDALVARLTGGDVAIAAE